MFWKILPYLIVIIFVSVAIGTGYILTAKMYRRNAPANRTNQFLSWVFLVSVPYAVVLYFLPASYKTVFGTILYVTWSMLLIVLLIAQLEGSRRSKMETTLPDLGVDPSNVLLLLFGALLLSWAAAFVTISIANSQTTVQTLSQFAVSILAGVLALYKGSSKTIFTENGIHSLMGYIEWTNIRSYEWDERKILRLALNITNLGITRNRAWINIAVSDKDAVQALLSRKLGKPKLSEGYETA